MSTLRILCIAALLASLSGCGFIRAGMAHFQSLDGFTELTDGSGIFYEDGARDTAVMAERYVSGSISHIERQQFKPFKRTASIYVCASQASFARYSGAPEAARGAVFDNKLFISPRAAETGTLQGILLHELSHLQFHRYLGNRAYASNVPPWFQEGLAVFVSNGAGAEKVTPETARRAILSGRSFAPNDSGSMLFPRTAFTFGLEPHMFYRQSSLFVGYLIESRPAGFENFMSALLEGAEFKPAFEQAFGTPIDSAWESFVEKLRS